MDKNALSEELRKKRVPARVYRESILEALRDGFSLAEVHRHLVEKYALKTSYDALRRQVRKWQDKPEAIEIKSKNLEPAGTADIKPLEKAGARKWDMANWDGKPLSDDELY